MARKKWAGTGLESRPALVSPENLSKPEVHVVQSSTKTALRNIPASRTTRRRWNRKPRATLSDAAVWTFYVLLTAAGLLAFCILATIVWPS